MQPEELKQRLEEQEKMLLDIYISVEKTRKYFMWTLIITIAMVVLPIIGMMIVVPPLLTSISTMYSGF
jgi:type IV secretory pathway component VirB8